MNNQLNLAIYRIWAPVYDLVMHPLFTSARRRAVELLNLQPGERVIIPGVGTGLDLPLLPPGVCVTATDLSPVMIDKARTKVHDRDVTLTVMDAQALQYPQSTFDAAILNLILSVVPDGAIAFREAWRLLRPGGRTVIFDKFLAETSALSPVRRALGKILSALGTDPNRRISEIIGGTPDLTVELDEPSLLNGQYRILVVSKRNNLE